MATLQMQKPGAKAKNVNYFLVSILYNVFKGQYLTWFQTFFLICMLCNVEVFSLENLWNLLYDKRLCDDAELSELCSLKKMKYEN